MSAYSKSISKPNQINEDSVQVNVFTLNSNVDAAFWDNLCKEINLTINTLNRDYIWHRDEFKLYVPILCGVADENTTYLSSTVCFGDNIEDEWYIVYLVMELSKIYTDLIIQLVDSDGDFLLIEAANFLPQWANPENTGNRVFIFDNKIHLIPPNLAELKKEINIKEALHILANYPEQTKVSSRIQEAIQTKIGMYPQKMHHNFHKAIVNLPLDIAALLSLQPSLIAPIVTTYCNHDTIDAKSCQSIQYTDLIPAEVKFTKCLYAMLTHSKIMRHVKNDFTAKNHKRDILGIKLTCGFQIIMNVLRKDVFSTKDYFNFEKNLKDSGYFKGNIEGSLEHNQLLEKAKRYFMDVECSTNSSVSKRITELMTTDEFLNIKKSLKYRNISDKDLNEDSDDWLIIKPIELNDLLNNRYGNQVSFETDDNKAPETITSKLTDFLKLSSDLEGVDINKHEDVEDDTINFDADDFKSCLEKIMNFVSSDVNDINLQVDSDIECESDISDDAHSDNELDKELAGNVNLFPEGRNHNKTIISNFTQSIKEEGLSGPSSNLLTSIGINKSDLLDSDDD